MSLESAITENTSAVRELIALLSVGVVIDKAQKKAAEDTKPEKKAKAEPKAEPKAKSDTASDTGNESEASAVTYEDVSNAIVTLHRTKGRDAAVALLQRFGLENARGATEDQWADIVAAAKEELE